MGLAGVAEAAPIPFTLATAAVPHPANISVSFDDIAQGTIQLTLTAPGETVRASVLA